MSKDNGGPAFPQMYAKAYSEDQGGMTLRDYFAGQAVQGMLANQHPYEENDERLFARDAYAIADAMLEARKS